MSKKTRNERKAEQAPAQTETTILSTSDVGSVLDVISDASASTPASTETTTEQAPAETAPVSDPVVPAEQPVGDASMGETLGLALPKAPEKAAVVIAAKGEPTRHQPMKLNHGFKEKGDRMAKNKAISNAGRLFKVGKGNGTPENTVWGHCLTVAKQVAASKEDGTFTAQELYNALFQTDWLAAGVTRVKYTPAQSVAYAGWIHDLVKGAPSKAFGIVITVTKEAPADSAE
jgi:hypothetical protein